MNPTHLYLYVECDVQFDINVFTNNSFVLNTYSHHLHPIEICAVNIVEHRPKG